MMLRVVTAAVTAGLDRIISWDIVPNDYALEPATYKYAIGTIPANFAMNYHTYAVSSGVLVSLGETLNNKVIATEDWDDTYDPMLTRVQDTFE